MVKIQNSAPHQAPASMCNTRNSHASLMEIQNGTAMWKTVYWFLTKLNIMLSYAPGIMHFCIYPKELNAKAIQIYFNRDIYSSFSLNFQNLEATMMSFSRWMDKVWYIQTMEHYSMLEKSEFSSHEMTCRNMKCLLLNEGSPL